jgi:hypothetical protein
LELVVVKSLVKAVSTRVVVLGKRSAIFLTSVRVAGNPENPCLLTLPKAPAKILGVAIGGLLNLVSDAAVMLLTRYFSTSHCLPS